MPVEEGTVGDADQAAGQADSAVGASDDTEVVPFCEVTDAADEKDGEEGFAKALSLLHQDPVNEFVQAVFARLNLDHVLFGGRAGRGEDADALRGDAAEMFDQVGHVPRRRETGRPASH